MRQNRGRSVAIRWDLCPLQQLRLAVLSGGCQQLCQQVAVVVAAVVERVVLLFGAWLIMMVHGRGQLGAAKWFSPVLQ